MTAPTIEVRRAQLSDLDTLVHLNAQVQDLHAALYPEYFKPQVDADQLRDVLSKIVGGAGDAVLVAMVAGVDAGYAWLGLQHRPETPFGVGSTRIYLHHICVDAGHRRKGVASALMASAKNIAAENGAEMLLDTWAANAEAQAFFRCCGFEPLRLLMRARITGKGDPAG